MVSYEIVSAAVMSVYNVREDNQKKRSNFRWNPSSLKRRARVPQRKTHGRCFVETASFWLLRCGALHIGNNGAHPFVLASKSNPEIYH
mmetsp:Transcript_2842/g.5284  ORF Transcript_2842/g.5284 Transcript_2842/m.5284 type:complete len:88 (+) Transcript_2842:104-367(+)